MSSGTEITTFMTKKFLDSAHRFLGALPSDSEIRQGSNPGEQLSAAETGLTFVKTLKTAKMRARILEFKRVELPFRHEKSVRMSFELGGGPLKEVMHAIVYCKTRVGTRIIDKIAIDENTPVYYFEDSLKFRQVGTKTYFVKLMYTDLHLSGPSKQIILKKESNLPRSFRRSKRTRRRTTRY